MDVLHFLKTHHDSIRDGFLRLNAASGVKARRAALDSLTPALEMHLTLEKDYLYPEVNGLYPGSDALVAAGLATVSVIDKRLKALAKLAARPADEQDGFEKRAEELRESVLKQLELEEHTLMPKMRSLIRTEDREDLGQVFMDFQADYAVGAKPSPAAAAAPAQTRQTAAVTGGRRRA